MSFQLGSALLDACVLAVLTKEDTYGYILTQQVNQIISISESTLYPVLRRLKANDYVLTYDKPYQGRNRRYYKISEKGKQKYKEYVSEWGIFKYNVDKILLGGIIDE